MAQPLPYWTKAADNEHETLVAPLLEVKAADDGSGELEGYAAVFGTVDLGGDLILPGAFKKSLAGWRRSPGRIPLVDGHLRDASTTLLGSVTKAEERTSGSPAGLWFRAKFSSDPASQVVRTKALEGHLTGVSIGWLPAPGGVSFKQGDDGEPVRILSEIKLFEISLTPIPMHTDARLTSVKSAISSHSTATSTGAWDGATAWSRLPAAKAALRGATAWNDPDADEATKAAYKFIHHEVAADGTVGAANLTACSTGIGVLNGGRAGTTIPDSDRKGVWNHLAAHLRSADKDVPELKALPMDFDTLELELTAALSLQTKTARRAAVDALLAGYQTLTETPPGPGADQPAPEPTAGPGEQPPAAVPGQDGQDDPRAYAYRFLRHPLDQGASGNGTPDDQPTADPLQVAQITADRNTSSLDSFEAEVKQLLGGNP